MLRVLPLLVVIAVLVGCSGEDDPGGVDSGSMPTDAGPSGTDAGGGGDVDAGPLTGESYLYVLSRMDLGFADPAGDASIVPGFDIDGIDSVGTDEQSCRKDDYTSPPPESEMGVDNQLGPILAELEGSYRIRENLEASVRSGELLVLLQVRGVDDFIDDDRVEVDALIGLLPDGVTMPTLDAMDRIAAGQTFDVDSSSVAADMMTALVTLRGRIEGGRLRAGPGDLTMSLPLEGDRVGFEAENAEIVFDITEDALGRGVMGGQLGVAETVAAMMGVEGFDADAARLVLEANADLDFDTAENECRAISIALVFDGASAMRGTVRAP